MSSTDSISRSRNRSRRPAGSPSPAPRRQGDRGRRSRAGEGEPAGRRGLFRERLMLSVEDIHSYYGESHVLYGVSLTVAKGELVAILGRNGMGKTTLIRALIGFTPPRAGRVLFKDRDVTSLPPFRAVEMGMGLVPQGRRIFPSLSVLENLKVAANVRARWNLDRVFSLFPRLAARKAHAGDNL